MNGRDLARMIRRIAPDRAVAHRPAAGLAVGRGDVTAILNDDTLTRWLGDTPLDRVILNPPDDPNPDGLARFILAAVDRPYDPAARLLPRVARALGHRPLDRMLLNRLNIMARRLLDTPDGDPLGVFRAWLDGEALLAWEDPPRRRAILRARRIIDGLSDA